MDKSQRFMPPLPSPGHIVDQMKVRAGWLGVQMVGIGNTLRNSVIEVDSRNAIALFGFGSIIENNTIIVHGKGTPAADDGALALWDGNGAVIRNDRFIFKGRARQAPPAIRLIDSSDVRLEGNTFEGFGGQVVARTGKSSFIEKNKATSAHHETVLFQTCSFESVCATVKRQAYLGGLNQSSYDGTILPSQTATQSQVAAAC